MQIDFWSIDAFTLALAFCLFFILISIPFMLLPLFWGFKMERIKPSERRYEIFFQISALSRLWLQIKYQFSIIKQSITDDNFDAAEIKKSVYSICDSEDTEYYSAHIVFVIAYLFLISSAISLIVCNILLSDFYGNVLYSGWLTATQKWLLVFLFIGATCMVISTKHIAYAHAIVKHIEWLVNTGIPILEKYLTNYEESSRIKDSIVFLQYVVKTLHNNELCTQCKSLQKIQNQLSEEAFASTFLSIICKQVKEHPSESVAMPSEAQQILSAIETLQPPNL